ncbi:MAG: type II 3-dehydroquinate dehydratase [Bacteroidales bacterium]
MKKVLIIHGPNLNLLGQREKNIYGFDTFENVLIKLKHTYPNLEIDYFQSNIEGEIVEAIQNADGKVDAIILNPGGFTHTSVAIRDAILAIRIPVTEIHISNIASREYFRCHSVISGVCSGCITGFGINGYILALENVLLLKKL